MDLAAPAYTRHLKALLPQGAAWDLEAASVTSQLLAAIAEELARIDVRARGLIQESDPRTCDETLPDWERVYGLPDLCVGTGQTEAQRRAALVARVVSLGGQTAAYYIGVAAALGYVITVTEFSPYDVEDDVDAFVYGTEWAYAWQVNAALNTVIEMTVDDGVDEPIAQWSNVLLECVLTRLKPAHTHLLFSYS